METKKYWTYDEQKFMHRLGFIGYGNRAHAGLAFFLCIVFGVSAFFTVYGIVEDLLIGTAVYDFFIDSYGNLIAVMFLGMVISFVAVIWKYWPVIILFILCTIITVLIIVFMVKNSGTENSKYVFPPFVRERLAPSAERLEEIEALKMVRFGRVKPTAIVKDIPEGVFVTITRNMEDGKTKDYTIRYHNTETKSERPHSAIDYIGLNRTVKTIAAGNLMSSSSPNADFIKVIPKNKIVTLTGGLSSDDLLMEVIHEGDKGWLAMDKMFKPLVMPGIINFTKLGIIVIVICFIPLYFLNFLRALNFNKIYRNQEIDYYKAKRAKFPWLDRYLTKVGEPVYDHVGGAFADMNQTLGKNIAIYLLTSIVLGFLMNLFIMGGGFSSDGGFILFNSTMKVMWIIGIVIIQIVWTNSVKELDPYSNKTECPDCKCPHCYDMIESENFLEKVVTKSGETITETTTTYSDGSKSTAIDKTPYAYDVYYGRSYEKFFCFNEDRETKKEYTNKWGDYPELGKKFYPKNKDKLAAQ